MAAKQRSAAVKNAKEYMASERELQATRKSAQEREAEVAKLVEAVETAQEVDRAARGRLRGAEGARGRRGEVGADERSPSCDAQIAAERKLREVAAARVRPDVLKKYSAIRMRRGLAMAPVKNGTCQGCNMNIPPQLFNLLQRGDSSSCAATATASSTGTSCWRTPTASRRIRRRRRRSSSFRLGGRRRGRGGRWRRKPREESPGSTGQGAG